MHVSEESANNMGVGVVDIALLLGLEGAGRVNKVYFFQHINKKSCIKRDRNEWKY